MREAMQPVVEIEEPPTNSLSACGKAKSTIGAPLSTRTNSEKQTRTGVPGTGASNDQGIGILDAFWLPAFWESMFFGAQ